MNHNSFSVLITGVAGFIGSNLAEKIIQSGGIVYGIDSFTDYYPRTIKENNLKNLLQVQNKNFHFIEGPLEHILLKPILKKVDYVFHLAAQAGVRTSWDKNFYTYTSNNINATQHILEECKNIPIKKFVFASSSSVYGNINKLPMHEDDELSPISPYGLTKLVGEKLCKLYCETFSIPVTSLRYFTVYGPRQRPDMAFHKFMTSIMLNKPIIIYGDGSQTRDFTFIDDIVNATINAALYGKINSIYNIGGGNRIKLIDAINLLKSITNKNVKLEFKEPQKGDVKDTYADTTKAKTEINYCPTTEIKKGLQIHWEWFQNNFKIYEQAYKTNN
jgi:UDP-glucose 4-epimerase